MCMHFTLRTKTNVIVVGTKFLIVVRFKSIHPHMFVIANGDCMCWVVAMVRVDKEKIEREDRKGYKHHFSLAVKWVRVAI